MWWGRANQREEKPVAKLQPTTCVMSQICGDKQPMTTTEAAPELHPKDSASSQAALTTIHVSTDGFKNINTYIIRFL